MNIHWIGRIIILLLLWHSPVLHAQYVPVDARDYISFEAGGIYSWHNRAPGFYFPYVYQFDTRPLPSAQKLKFLELGTGFGFRVGGALDIGLHEDAAVRVSLHYAYQTTSKREQANYDCAGNIGTFGMATLETYYYARWEYIGADIFLRKSLFGEKYYGLLGAGYSYLLSDRLNGSQEIIATNNNCEYLWLPSGDKSGNTVVGVEDQTSKNYYARSQYYTKVGFGAFFPITEDLVFSPEFLLNIPLERILSSSAQAEYSRVPAATPKLWSTDLVLSIRYAIGEPPREYMPEPERRSMQLVAPPRELERKKGYALTGKVRSSVDNLPMPADITITRLDSAMPAIKNKTSVIGYYNILVPSPGTYSVTATADQYLFGSTLFVVNPDGSVIAPRHDVTLSPEDGKTRLLIFFDLDKADLRDISYPELDRAVALMREVPSMYAEIAGHTDSTGTVEHNNDLSKRRAESVRAYLISKGIRADRITAEGYGSAQPVAQNSFESGRAENRRVEFVVKKR